jgi:hypothetical protein
MMIDVLSMSLTYSERKDQNRSLGIDTAKSGRSTMEEREPTKQTLSIPTSPTAVHEFPSDTTRSFDGRKTTKGPLAMRPAPVMRFSEVDFDTGPFDSSLATGTNLGGTADGLEEKLIGLRLLDDPEWITPDNENTVKTSDGAKCFHHWHVTPAFASSHEQLE